VDLLRELFPHTGRALTLGITGAPGVGKSTLVDRFLTFLRADGRTVSVIAVDPTSPFTGGAILGDRVRMLDHHGDAGVFIRSMATRGRLGGLAPATSDLLILLDAAGFDVVVIETVGVGQDEIEIARVADVTAVVLAPGMGDDVQAIKAGIMEIADVYILNKADQPGIEKLERDVKSLDSHAPVVLCSNAAGTAEALNAIGEIAASDLPRKRAQANWAERLRAMFRERLTDRLDPSDVDEAARAVADRHIDPYTVIDRWLGNGPR
jgi:LAO/AO transport system kinase